MEEATAVAGMVELQVERASVSLPREDENEKSVGNVGSCKGLNTGLVYTPMRITRSMASLSSAFTRSLGLAGGGTPGEGEGEGEGEAEAEAEVEADSAGVKKTGKRTNGRGARKKWGKSSVVEQLDTSEGEMKASGRKKAVNVKAGAKAADGKGSKAQAGKKKVGRASASRKKEKKGEKVDQPVHTANEVDQVGEDVSSGVTEGDTAKANQVQTKQKLSSSPVGWVMCDDCAKWRCISAELADRIEASDARWTCRDNPNRTYADCSVPQEKSNAEINAELNITEGSSSECDDADAVVNSKSRATWTQIRRNIFAHRKPKNSDDEDEGLTCQCKPPKDGLGCGDGCLNRMMNVECSPETCPCGDRCSNQQFQKRMYAKFALVRCGKKGFGLRAREFIRKGSFIIEYVGEVLNAKAFGARQKDYDRQRQKHFYFMTLSSSEVIDACRKGNYGRFINHSCEPNCQTEKWVVNGEVCIGLFAIRDVRENEEITFNYNYERLLGAAAKKCRCGSANCHGYIGGNPSSPMDVVPSESEDDLEPVMVKEVDDSEEEDLTETQESVQDMKATPASDVLPWESTMEPEREPEREHVTETGPRPEPEHQPQQEPEPAPELKPKSLLKPLETKPEALKPKTRIKRLKSSGRPKKAQPKVIKSFATPKRFISEVEEKLDNLLNQEGGLVKKKDTPKQYLKLLVIATASGDSSTSCNMRELSLLLDAILKTASRTILTEVIQKNGLQLLHNLVKQSRKIFTRTPILRKLLKVLAFFAEKKIINSQDMTLAASRNGTESFVKSIFELQRHEDSEVQQLSRRFQKQWLPDALDLLAHESSGNQTVHRSWGPDRFSQRRELFHSRPDDRQRKYKRPDDSDRQDRNQDVKRRRISRWDEAPSSAPAPSHHQSHSGSQESRPTSREHAQEDASEPPGYGSRCSQPQQPVDYHNQPRDNWNHHWNQREQVRDHRGGYSYHPPNESSHYSDYPGRRHYQQPQHEAAHSGASLHPPRYSRAAAAASSRAIPPVNGYYYPPPPSYTHPHGVVEPSSHYRNVSGCYSHPPQQYPADDEPPVPGL